MVSSRVVRNCQRPMVPYASNRPLLFSFRISDGMYFAVSFALALLWLGVVIAGFIKCGWAGLLMLIPVK
jgi:hypothetical protein